MFYSDGEEVTLEEEIMKAEHHYVMNEGTPYEDGIEAHLYGVSMQVVKHRMDAWEKIELGHWKGIIFTVVKLKLWVRK